MKKLRRIMTVMFFNVYLLSEMSAIEIKLEQIYARLFLLEQRLNILRHVALFPVLPGQYTRLPEESFPERYLPYILAVVTSA